jgi:hypothetical protein
VDFFVKHPEFAALIALAAVIAIWLWYRRWEQAGGREAARWNKAIARLPVIRRSRVPLAFDQLRDKIHRDFVTVCRPACNRWREHPEEYHEPTLRRVLEHLIDAEAPLLNRIEYEKLISDVIGMLGFGPKPEPPPGPPDDAIQLKVPRRSES